MGAVGSEARGNRKVRQTEAIDGRTGHDLYAMVGENSKKICVDRHRRVNDV